MTFDPVALNTETPVDVVAALSLTVGESYGAQFQGPGVLGIRESVTGTVPGLDESFAFATNQPIRLTPQAGEGIWCYVASLPAYIVDNSAQLVVWEE